ncbi:hypothetical protein KIN20_008153 [Parelaphostrongylus tenuis]|uniref:Ig-like domain-containing protein n=1 Tax=Parelaphostrongylus tenuis TaxID=148309 RepID=A0AAD5QKG5_PARTN|nr:hypothetical protein KIN20_008153 [Parelaphostrongylus tenuis]
MDRRSNDDTAPRRSEQRELRVDIDGSAWNGMPSPRRVATAPSSPSTSFRTDEIIKHQSSTKSPQFLPVRKKLHTTSENRATQLINCRLDRIVRRFSARETRRCSRRMCYDRWGMQSNSFTEEHWSSEIKSFIAAAPPKFIQVIKAYRILSTDMPTLVVEVVSDPPAIFEWFCNDRPVQQDRRRFRARHGLNITTLTVKEPEQGVYKCTARNPAGVSTSYGYITVNFEHQNDDWTIVEKSMATEEGQTSVTIHRAPRFVNQVPNLTVQPGTQVVIDVEVDAVPPARFLWSVNGREYRESSNNVEFYYPSPNRCVAKFALPVSGEYKVVASNLCGSAMSCGYVEIHKAIPSKQMRPPLSPGEHLSRNIMASNRQSGSAAADEREVVQTQTMDVYEMNYSQRSSSVPRGVRHLESHVERPHSSTRNISLERHRAELGSNLPERLPRSLYKTRSEGSDRDLPHPPKFFTTLPSQITLNPTEKLVLSVGVTANPTAHFMWDVNGFEVRPSRNITVVNEHNRSTLEAQPPVKQGNYSVTAFNDLGRERMVTRVVQEVHETYNIIEEIQKEIKIDTSIKPDIMLESSVTVTNKNEDVSTRPGIMVESSVTVTSKNEDEKETLKGISSNLLTISSKTIRSMEPVNPYVAQEIPISRKEIEKVRETVDEVEVHGQMVNGVTTYVERVSDSSTHKVSENTSLTKSVIISKSQENIPRRPVLLSPPIQNIHVAHGETLTLETRVDCTPPATFRWYVNNFEVKNGPLISISQPQENVSVASFSKPITGQYKVVASNSVGEVTAITKVISEVLTEDYKERIIATSVGKPGMFAVAKKPAIGIRADLPKPPHIVERLPAMLKINFTEPITLKVTADAVPEATFLWLLNNFELKQSSNVHIKRIAANVSELSLQIGQHGRYDVIAKNPLGQDSCSCKVIVEHRSEPYDAPKPFFISPLLPETTMCPGEETKFEVVVSGAAPFKFIWLLNGAEIQSEENSRISIQDNRAMLILRKPLENGNVIEVEVVDKNGSARSKTVIILKSKATDQVDDKVVIDRTPVFVEELKNQNLVEGDTLKCKVKIKDESEPCTFEWYANKIRIICGDQVVIESSGHESSLLIENMGDMNDVKLSAVARNEHGSSITSAVLNVSKRQDESFEMVSGDLPEEIAPKIIEPLHSTSFIKGQPMLLRCRIEAIPSALIMWHKDDINVEEWVINKDVVTRVLPGGICEMMNPEVCLEDTGLYKCTATNSHGTAETAAFVHIVDPTYQKTRDDASASDSASLLMPEKAESPPKFVEGLTAETDGAYELNYVRLTCRITSSAPVKVSWWKDEVELISSEKYEFHEFSDGALILTIHTPATSDNGVYTCKATSQHGASTSSCEVFIPTRRTVTEKVTESSEQTTTIVEQRQQVFEENKEDYVATTEITKREEEYKLLVKVADSVASALVANVFVSAVREAVKRIIEEESEEEEEIDTATIPRFDSSIERCVVKENETLTITTVVSGVPTPFIEWYFEDQKLYVTNRISMGYEKQGSDTDFEAYHPITRRDVLLSCHESSWHDSFGDSCQSI